MTITRNGSHTLSATASRVGATVLGGQLIKEDNQYFINKTNVTRLLEQLLQQNVLLIIEEVSEEKQKEVRVCLTCGREYTGAECPHCARVRARLRG